MLACLGPFFHQLCKDFGLKCHVIGLFSLRDVVSGPSSPLHKRLVVCWVSPVCVELLIEGLPLFWVTFHALQSFPFRLALVSFEFHMDISHQWHMVRVQVVVDVVLHIRYHVLPSHRRQYVVQCVEACAVVWRSIWVSFVHLVGYQIFLLLFVKRVANYLPSAGGKFQEKRSVLLHLLGQGGDIGPFPIKRVLANHALLL